MEGSFLCRLKILIILTWGRPVQTKDTTDFNWVGHVQT